MSQLAAHAYTPVRAVKIQASELEEDDSSHTSSDVTIFLLAGPILCGKSTFLRELSPNILDITELIARRLGYRHAVDISLVLRLLGYNLLEKEVYFFFYSIDYSLNYFLSILAITSKKW